MRFRAFFCMWTRTLWVFLGSQTSIFGFSRANLQLQTAFGSFRGRPCFKTHRKPRVFGRFLRFCVIQRALRSSLFFQTWYEKRAFSRIFGAAGVITVPCLLFRRFGLLALQKRHPKLILGISRAMHGPKNLIL